MYKRNYFNYQKRKKHYLLTNDFGNYVFLSHKHFKALLDGEKLPRNIYEELKNKQFVYEEDDDLFAKIHAEKLLDYKGYLNEGTVLHIFVVSKNCNYNCVYCQAGNLNQKEEYAMNETVAQKAVDIAFESSAKNLTFEFQGGEPLLNFSMIQFIVKYSQEKNLGLKEEIRKNIEYHLVSNLSLMTEDIFHFIVKNHITVCTSIDGNKALQNINRPCNTANSYDKTIENLKKLQEANVPISALLTTTRYSLNEAKSIVDEYIKLGLSRIVIRPLTRLGKADGVWNEIGYTAEEFLAFYKEVLAYVIQKNKKGVYLSEGMASILLAKILKLDGGNYMELRSPCGGAIGQLAYYYNGEIYTCDEGRMLAEMNDKKFLLGSVFESHYQNLIENEITKQICTASCLECSKVCHSCVYMPYCGTCPVLNYAHSGKMELQNKNDFKCQIMQGMLKVLFDYLENDKIILKIFESWIS